MSRHIRPPSPETTQDALAYTERMVEALFTEEGIGDGTGTYDTTKQRYESYMVAGNGPSVWVVFLFDDTDDLSDAFVQYHDGEECAYVDVPRDAWTRVLTACQADSRRRESPEHSGDAVAKLMETFGIDERAAIAMHRSNPKEAR